MKILDAKSNVYQSGRQVGQFGADPESLRGGSGFSATLDVRNMALIGTNKGNTVIVEGNSGRIDLLNVLLYSGS